MRFQDVKEAEDVKNLRADDMVPNRQDINAINDGYGYGINANQLSGAITNGLRNDEAIFSALDLALVKAKTYFKKYPQFRAMEYIPRRTDMSAWTNGYVDRIYDHVGMAKIIANYTDDLPRSDVLKQEQWNKVHTLGGSYGFSIIELRMAQLEGTPLDTAKANATKKSIDLALNMISVYGEAKYGLYGLANHPNIGYTAINGNWSAPATTGMQIFQDMVTLYNTISVGSWSVHEPNLMVLPTAAYSAAASKFISELNVITPLEHFRRMYPGVRVIEDPVLTNADQATGQNMVFCGEFNSDNFSLDMPQPFEQLPAQARNLEIVVNCIARTGGVTVRYPLSITKAIGV